MRKPQFPRPYADLREFIRVLHEQGKLVRVHRRINKDTELQPLARWQLRGLPEEARKADFPALSLPRREYMVRAREIWEELVLPALQPQEPWHGYLMGLWPEDLEREAELATCSEYERVGEKLARTRRAVGQWETLKSMRADWGRSRSGRSE